MGCWRCCGARRTAPPVWACDAAAMAAVSATASRTGVVILMCKPLLFCWPCWRAVPPSAGLAAAQRGEFVTSLDAGGDRKLAHRAHIGGMGLRRSGARSRSQWFTGQFRSLRALFFAFALTALRPCAYAPGVGLAFLGERQRG